MNFTLAPPTTEIIDSELADRKGVQVAVLRLDKLHAEINGNKWYKLKYNLEDARRHGHSALLSFGGAHSNHLAALAAAGKYFDFKTIGIVRGEQPEQLSPTLVHARENGMQLEFISRTEYREGKDEAEFHAVLHERFPDAFIIPEGGKNNNGIRGCMEITGKAAQDFDTICLACGTGATLAGLSLSLSQTQRVLGFPVLAGAEYLQQEIDQLISQYLFSGLPAPGDAAPWLLNHGYHFGGYAKTTSELLIFKQQFENAFGIPLDYVYTAKAFFGVMDLIENDFFARGERVLILHTGGLQGNAAMEQRLRAQQKQKPKKERARR